MRIEEKPAPLIGTLSSRTVDRFARPDLRTAKYRVDALPFKIYSVASREPSLTVRIWCKFRFQSGPQGLSAAGGVPRRCVSRARVPNASFRGTDAKTEGLFFNRAAYRR